MVAQTATTTSGTLMRNATRHEIVSTRMPPMNGPRNVVAADARQRDGHDGRVDEYDRRSEYRRDKRPARATVHIRSPASMATCSLFPSGARGQTHFGS